MKKFLSNLKQIYLGILFILSGLGFILLPLILAVFLGNPNWLLGFFLTIPVAGAIVSSFDGGGIHDNERPF